jgi:hypothetical protein
VSEDATFEEGRDRPLNLAALEPDDLTVISALVQDAVFPITEMSWQAGQRRFALLVNRFRWEDSPAAEARSRTYERVQSVLLVDNVLKVSSQGVDRSERDVILSLLSVTFEPGDAPSGHVILTLAGDGAIRLEVEALDVSLRDVTRPYAAVSGKAPDHSGG